MFAFLNVSGVLGNLTTLNLNLQKSCCVNLNMSAGICSVLEKRNKTNYTLDQEVRVQELVTNMTM